MPEMKRCPYCAEEIQAAAVRCRYCRSRLTTFDTEHWHRAHPEARWGGVCAALSHALSLPLPAIRLAFIVFTLITHIAPVAYLGLWLLIPARPDSESILERVLHATLDLIGSHRSTQPPRPR